MRPEPGLRAVRGALLHREPRRRPAPRQGDSAGLRGHRGRHADRGSRAAGGRSPSRACRPTRTGRWPPPSGRWRPAPRRDRRGPPGAGAAKRQRAVVVLGRLGGVLLVAQDPPHEVGGLPARVVEDVAVEVHQRGDLRVPEQVHHHPRRHLLRQEQRRAPVPLVVEPRPGTIPPPLWSRGLACRFGRGKRVTQEARNRSRHFQGVAQLTRLPVAQADRSAQGHRGLRGPRWRGAYPRRGTAHTAARWAALDGERQPT
jgi:hypothetical protein